MTEQTLHAVPDNLKPLRSSSEADKTLDDAPYIAYALIQAFKLFTALVTKRWPQLR